MRLFTSPVKNLLLLFTAGSLMSGCVPAVITSATATTAMMAHDRRTVGKIIDDRTIELRAQSKMNQIPEARDYGHISVTSYNNIVLVTGQVPYDYVKDQVTDSVNSVPGVRRVFNELTVADSNSLIQRSKDSWTTAKIKTALLAQGHIDPTRIKIITENDVVYLLGLVNFQEAEIASEIAQKTNGVKEVIRAFEYM